ncbi:unnamed protein product, partial [Sphacelaria rigidula]
MYSHPRSLRKQGAKVLLSFTERKGRKSEKKTEAKAEAEIGIETNRGRWREFKGTEKRKTTRTMKLKDTVDHVQEHSQGPAPDHRPRKKSTTDKRGQGHVTFRVEPALPTQN